MVNSEEPKRRVAFVLIDAVGDVSLPRFGHKTPLQLAKVPNLDAIASAGVNGLMDPVEVGLACGSDTAHLSLLGYDPRVYYRGRGAFESMGAGLAMSPGDIAFKSNFATLDEETGIVISRRADRHFEEEGPILCAALDGMKLASFPEYEVRVRYATEHRCGVVLKGPNLSGNISGTDPLKDNRLLLQAEGLDETKEAKHTASVVNELSKEISRILASHRLNVKWAAEGKNIANVVLLRGCGIRIEKFPSARSAPPPGAPYSGCLVVTDEEAEAQEAFCCGVCKNKKVTNLPFPQDKILKIVHSSGYEDASVTKVWSVPVLGQPLSSNRYYVIKAEGKHKGLAFTCSREDDVTGCCLRDVIPDVKPIPFNHQDIYQQVDIHHHFNGSLYAISVAGDGFPPKFLRRRGWRVCISTSLHVRETQGLQTSLQIQLPPFDFPAYFKCSPLLVVAKWYCPFVFVKEEADVDYQVRRSMLYEMTLQQWWEEIYSCDNERNEGNIVFVNRRVEREAVLVYGVEGAKDDRRCDDGFVWFRVNYNQFWRRGVGVGLSSAVVEKMRWVEEGRGWGNGGGEREAWEGVERVWLLCVGGEFCFEKE